MASNNRFPLKQLSHDANKNALIELLKIISNGIEEGTKISARFDLLLDPNTSATQLTFSTQKRTAENNDIYLFPADLIAIVRDAISQFIGNKDIPENFLHTLDEYGSFYEYLETNNFVQRKKQAKINSSRDKRSSENIETKTNLISSLLQKLLVEVEKTQQTAADDLDTSDDTTDTTDDEGNNLTEEQLAAIAAAVADQKKDVGTATTPTGQQSAPPTTDQHRDKPPAPPSPDDYTNPLENRETRIQLARIRSVALIALFAPLDLEFNDLSPVHQRELERLSFDVVEQLILKMSPDQLADLERNPSARLALMRQALTQLHHTPRFMMVYQQTVDEHFLKLQKEAPNQASDFDQKITQAKKETNADYQTRLNELNNQHQEAFANASQIPGFNTNYQSEFTSKISQILNLESHQAQIFTLNFDYNVCVHIAGKYSPEYIETLSYARFIRSFQVQITRSQFNSPQFKSLLKYYWKLRVAELSRIFGPQVETVWQANSEEGREALKEQTPAQFDNHIKTLITPFRKAKEKQGLTGEEAVGATNTSHGDTTDYAESPHIKNKTKYRQSVVEALRTKLINELWQGLKENQQEDVRKFYGVKKSITSSVMIPLQTNIAHMGAIPPNPEFGDYGDYGDYPGVGGRFPLRMPGSPTGSLKNMKGAGKRVAEFGKKAFKKGKKALKGANKALDGVDSLATKAITAYNPAVGAFVNAIPKKIRKGLIVGGILGGIGAALGSIAYAMQSVGGSIFGALGGIAGGIFGGAPGAIAGTASGAFFGHKLIPWKWSDIFSGGKGAGQVASSANKAATGLGQAAGDLTKAAAQTTPLTTAARTAKTLTLSKASSALFSTTAGQAIGFWAGLMVVGTIMVTTSIESAFLADFATFEPITFEDPQQKTSKYVTIEKTVSTGCADNKCEELSSSQKITAQYQIKIIPKDNFTITLVNISDEITVNFNPDEYQSLPSKPPQTRTADDFDKVNVGDIIPQGGVLLTYTQEYDSTYNHSTIRNFVDFSFLASDSNGSYNDNVSDSEFVYIGEYPQGQGCWPASGTLQQLPYGNFSHSPPNAKGYSDSYDISNNAGTTIYAPYAGELCPGPPCEDVGFGCYVTLKSNINGAQQTFLFAHFEEMPTIVSSGCKTISDGTAIGPMGNRGYSTNPHLHYEVSHNGGWYRADGKTQLLQTLVPADNSGNHPPQKDKMVSHCYGNN